KHPQQTRLIAVAKTVSAEDCKKLLQLGHRRFGENRIQEAHEKWPRLRESYSNIELHLIGPLQSNKVNLDIELFDVIQSLDREKKAIVLDKEEEKQQKPLHYYIRINIGEESQNSVIHPLKSKEFTDYCWTDPGLNICGMM